MAWKKDPEKRGASIAAQKRSPAGRAQAIETNRIRWARAGERAKLAERNRLRWADPATAAAQGAAIRAAWTPERRAKLSAARTRQWAEDDAYRAATVAGIRRCKGSPEARAKFSALLRARWQDPQWRNRWLTGIARAASDPSIPESTRRRLRQITLKLLPLKTLDVIVELAAEQPRKAWKQFSMLGDTWDGWRDRKPRHSVERRP